MMDPVILKIPKTSDKVLLDFCLALSESYECTTIRSTFIGGGSLSGLPDFEDENWAVVSELNSALIATLNIAIGGLSIQYYRNSRTPELATVFDEISIGYNSSAGSISQVERLRIIAAVSSKLKAFDPEAALITSGIQANNHLEALHQSTLTRLEQLSEEIIRKGIETHSRLEAEFAEKRKLQEDELAEAKALLNRHNEAEQLKLQTAQEDLERRKASLDDRGNTHARREIRNSMLNDVKTRIENFGVSDLTSDKRTPVKRGLIALAVAFALFLVTTSFEIYQEHATSQFDYIAEVKQVAQINNPKTAEAQVSQPVQSDKAKDRTAIFYLWLRFSLLSAGMLGTLFYYVRWQNRWAEQHAASEFQLQQFYIDVNRANWIIESGLEWRKETETEMPDIVLQSITKNLFNSAHEVAPALHPADELASALLGSASKLKLKAGDSEIEFDKPGKIPKT
jgi:hypothetical protein